MTRPLVFMAIVAAGLALGLVPGIGAARAEPSSATIDPPTIETVRIAARGASAIEGQGTSGSLIRLTSDGRTLGEARVAADRQWRVEIADGLAPGIYRIEAAAAANGTAPFVSGDEVRVSVPVVLGETAVVAYDGAREPAVAEDTRRRAEQLAREAGEAFDTVGPGKNKPKNSGKDDVKTGSTSDGARPNPAAGETSAGIDAVSVVVDWLKRSARAYRDEIVEKLTVPGPGPGDDTVVTGRADAAKEADGVSAAEAARRIAEERRKAEETLALKRKAEADRKAADAEKAAEEKLAKDAAARQAAEDVARRMAEDRRKIDDALKQLENARKEADAKAKAQRDAAGTAPTPAAPTTTPTAKQTITLEPFTLPGDKAPEDRERDLAEVAPEKSIPHARLRKSQRPSAGRCEIGRVVMRKGRRWYITGREDTLWDIAERFYGTGVAYPRIYRVNRSRLSSPHVVRPCLALRLPHRRR